MGFLAMLNPAITLPVFVGITVDQDRQGKRYIARFGVLLAFGIVLIFCLVGQWIFQLFGITLTAFRIAGGILLFSIGFQMLHGEESTVNVPSPEEERKSLQASLSVAVSPLAVPILAGPGAIATAMNFSVGKDLTNLIITITAFGVLCFMNYLAFLFGERFIHYIGESAIKVISRMMGLILAVIGTQMCIAGLGSVVASWKL